MESFKDTTIERFTYQLASTAPTPGGGAVAALVAALSAGLSSMVFNLTVNKRGYEGYDEERKRKIEGAVKGINVLLDDFLKFIDEDVKVFNGFIDILRLPKETEEQREFREERLQEGYRAAMEVPYRTLNKVYELFEYFDIGARYGNENLISDVGVGVILAQAAIEASIINMDVNLCGMKDREFVDEIKTEYREILEKSHEKKAMIMEIVNNKL